VRHTILRNVVLALAYFVVAWISLLFAYRDLQITAIWLPSGMALAAVLVYGARMWAGILIGDLLTGIVFGTPFPVAIFVAIAAVLEALVGARLLPKRESVRSAPLFGVSQVLRFVLRGAIIAPIASTVVGTGAMYLGGLIKAADLPRAVSVWWTGDVVGILLVMPPVLLVLATGRLPRLRSSLDPLILALTVGVTAVVFFLPGLAHTSGSALAYLIFPMLGWCAFAFTASLLAATNLLIAIVAVSGTALSLGPFAVTESMTDIWYLQAFVATFATTSLMLRGAIEDRRRSAKRATEVERHFLVAAENGAHVVLIAQRSQPDEPMRIVYANRRAQAMFAPGVRIEDAPALASAFPVFAATERQEDLARVLRDQKSNEQEIQLSSVDSTPMWFRCTMIPLERGLMLTMLDITEQKVAQERIARLAVTDPLTGLPNRVRLNERLEVEIDRARREKISLGVLFVDVNDFKNVNDTAGHHAGDEMLTQIARRLESAVRQSDLLSRQGGDEFVVLSPDARGSDEITDLAQRILASFRHPFVVRDCEFHISCSIGIAILGMHGDDAQTLLRNADTAMYHAKRSGRGNLSLFDGDMAQRMARRRQIEAALRGAIEREEIALHYQPILSFADGRVMGAEALLRWTHPELGDIAPSEFVGIAEQSGLIEVYGEWVLAAVARQIRQWRGSIPGEFRIAVNLSANQMNHKLVDKVRAALTAASIDRPWLELEITESLLMRDLEQCSALLAELRALGVTIAVDDFGTGYSSLSYLKSLPIDVVKVDRSFVRNIRSGTADARLVAAVVALCQAMDLRIVAEGVESIWELNVLRGVGCDDYQGFVASEAIPSTEFYERFLPAAGSSGPDTRTVSRA